MFSQTVHTRTSYRFNEVRWGATFKLMYDNEEKGITTLKLNEINSIEEVDITAHLPVKN